MVKVLDEPGIEFDRQLEILTHVEHDHLIRLIGLCQEVQPHYMILEYTDWVSLFRWFSVWVLDQVLKVLFCSFARAT